MPSSNSATVRLRAGAKLRVLCTSRLARFRAPKEFPFVEHVQRLGNGKTDYRWAKRHATAKASATT